MFSQSEAADHIAAGLPDRYTLERELGRGGMATVYLAIDRRHDRRVALKCLHPALGSVLAVERFGREIAIAARLSHPNIVPLLDSGTLAGAGVGTILYYTMPYVEGRSLRDQLRVEPQLPVFEAVRVTCSIAQALDHAHAQGVVHRDIKPENILLSGGHAMVADFGIARALDLAGGEKLTETGFVVGTPAYMSPEQGAAGAEIDGRSDVYSLASVLYEMLAGEPPYTGPNVRAVIAKRISEPVPRISVVRETVPAHVENALLKALAAAPGDRFATAGEFAAALTGTGKAAVPARQSVARNRRRALWVGVGVALAAVLAFVLLRSGSRDTTKATVDPNVVAVLPFRVTARDTSYYYLREGVVDFLGAQLTGDGLPRAVDSRTLLSRWRQATASGAELTTAQAIALAQGLGAGQVLFGEFVITRARMSVSGRLLRVPDGGIITEHTEAARAGSMDELALLDRLLGRMLALILGENRGRLPHLSDSAAAARAYLAGRQKQRSGEWEAALQLYQRALEIDSTFALAAFWATVGGTPEWRDDARERAWAMRDRLSPRDRAQLVAELGPRYPATSPTTEVLQASEQAVALNPDRPEALERLGSNLFYHGALASVEGWLPRATVAVDSAIRLDSTFILAVWTRVLLSVTFSPPEEIRRIGSLYLRQSTYEHERAVARWLVADALDDSSTLGDLEDRLPPGAWAQLVPHTTLAGRSLERLDRVGLMRFTGGPLGSERRCAYLDAMWHISAVRGQVARAIAVADSMNLDPTPRCGARRVTITLSLVEPGYDAAADRYAAEQGDYADTTTADNQSICLIELRRIARGDTTGTRRAVARIRGIVRNRPAATLGGEVCPSLLEAALESTPPDDGESPALDRLEQLLSKGIGHLAMAGNVANLLLARRFEARGDVTSALRAVRRRPQNYNWFHTMLLPAYLRDEGRLAALAGDTAGAIRAYQHYLRLRDRPDPGPMQDQVNQVRAQLAELVGEPRRT